MEKVEFIKELTEVFREIFNNNDLELSDNLTAKDVDEWDSLTHMLLITDVENKFNIKFKLKELNKMKNVGDMIKIIHTKL